MARVCMWRVRDLRRLGPVNLVAVFLAGPARSHDRACNSRRTVGFARLLGQVLRTAAVHRPRILSLYPPQECASYYTHPDRVHMDRKPV
jgi:hypothetical protein